MSVQSYQPAAAAPPQPVPAPAPASARPFISAAAAALVLAAAVVLASGLIGTALIVRSGHPDAPVPAFNFLDGGKATRADLCTAAGDAVLTGEAQMRAGKPFADIKAAVAKDFRDRWNAAFDKRFEAGLDEILPPDSKEPTPDQRTRYADAFHGIGVGLKERVR